MTGPRYYVCRPLVANCPIPAEGWVRAENGFAITADTFLAAVTPRTRAIVLNSPSNPTGALLSEAEAAILAREAARLGLWIVIDLCYERLIYDGAPHNLPKIFGDAMRDFLAALGAGRAPAIIPIPPVRIMHLAHNPIFDLRGINRRAGVGKGFPG